MSQRGEIIIYPSKDGIPDIEVRLENDSLWLDQYQISELFQTDRTSIVRHIRNIYLSGELIERTTCAVFTQVQDEGKRKVTRQIRTYNLDMIISVGYRVNSIRGTQFRIWSNNIIKQHLIKGFSRNDKRLEELRKTIEIIHRTADHLQPDEETKGLIDVLADYSMALDLLDDYDHQRLSTVGLNHNIIFRIGYSEAINAIAELRAKFRGSSLFGNEKDASFRSSIATIDQTFDGTDLYPSIEEKAANLLYFVTKNHSFTDGNKRIAAWLFLWYLDKNNFLYKPDRSKKIADNALVALTLMIAESQSEEKDMMIRVIVNLINERNN